MFEGTMDDMDLLRPAEAAQALGLSLPSYGPWRPMGAW
jgi:hypothetical protein